MPVGDLEWLTNEKKLLEGATREHDRKLGEIKQIKKQLRELFGVKETTDIQQLVEQEEAKAAELDARYQKELQAYLKVRGEQLGVMGE